MRGKLGNTLNAMEFLANNLAKLKRDECTYKKNIFKMKIFLLLKFLRMNNVFVKYEAEFVKTFLWKIIDSHIIA